MKVENAWDQIVAELEMEMTNLEFKMHLSPARIKSGRNGEVLILCSNVFSKKWLMNKYSKKISYLLKKKTGKEILLKFEVQKQEEKTEDKNIGPLFTPATNNVGLDPLCTIDNFAVSGSNQLAYAAANAVIKNPGKTYNPLFLWGGVGVGKTHLMQAIGHEILKQDANANIVFSMGEEFTNEIIAAIQNNTTSHFKKKYRKANLLLLDDIQFIAGKIKVQEEFFHTFVSIKREGGQIVLTSDRPPHEIPELEERLRSRFEAGLIADISEPNFELRTAIVLIKAKQRGKKIPMSVAQYLAEKVKDTRRLEGVLIRLLTQAEISHQEITVSFASEKLEQEEKNGMFSRPRLSPTTILKIVSSHFGITLADLKGEKRSRQIAVPRQIAMYLLRKNLELSYEDIGSFLGGRDHTTIMHGVKKTEDKLLKEPEYRGDILGIKKQLWG